MVTAASDFGQAERDAVYRVIGTRRDVRTFRPGVAVPEEALQRILAAAHQAPSVGFCQPWDFILVRDPERRGRIRESFLRCREAEAQRFEAERRTKYLSFRLEGILESSVNLCVTVDLRPSGEGFVGATSQPEALRWSACCAVQNLWLAARAEGIGVGWVSIVEPSVLRAEFELPPGVEPVAYLCIGYPVAFGAKPELESAGWRARRPLPEAIHEETFRPGSRPAQARVPVLFHEVAQAEIPDIPPLDETARAAAVAHQAQLTKPAGSLGRLESLATWYASVRGTFPVPRPGRAELAVFAADHGVVAEGISAYPSSVTPAMVANFLAGGAAVNVLARECGVGLTVVDVGVAGDLTGLPKPQGVCYVSAKVAAGTANFAKGAAMSRLQAAAALQVGIGLAVELGERTDILAAGEMGIGNTTAAAALCAVFTGLPPRDLAGAGTGLDRGGIAHKADVIEAALAVHRPDPHDPLGVLAAVGGFEIAAMAGFMLGGASRRRPVIVDGFISLAAALVAIAFRPGVREYLCLSHLSAERGHGLVCAHLKLDPLLDLGMRLGEGTGAVLAAHLLRTAVAAQDSMATFATAGIPGRTQPA